MSDEQMNNIQASPETAVPAEEVAANAEKEKAEAEAGSGEPISAPSPVPAAERSRSFNPRGRNLMGRGRGPGRGPGRGRGQRPGDMPVESDYEEKNLEVTRVTRVTKGGKRMRFRALTVIGNRKGRVGFGLAKGLDVAGATSKATTQARKALLTVPLVNETIPHRVEAKFAAARILLKPAPKGTGIKAGGSVRNVLELAGVPNVTAKILGSGSKINNVKATFMALRNLRAPVKPVKESAEPKT